MTEAIHISQARKLLDERSPVDLRVVKRTGEIITLRQAVSLKYDFYEGTRNMKILSSGRIVKIREALIIGINDFSVFV